MSPTSIQKPRLEDLVPGIEVGGLVGAIPVTVVQVQWHGVNFITLTYKDGNGDTGQIVVGRDKEGSLRVTSAGTGPAFDGDPESWRIGAEALRIHYAALFDPMLAITTSDLDALPHQSHQNAWHQRVVQQLGRGQRSRR